MQVSSIGNPFVTYRSIISEEESIKEYKNREIEENLDYKRAILKKEIEQDILYMNGQFKALEMNLTVRYEASGDSFSLLIVNSKTDEILKVFSSSIALDILAQLKELLGVLVDIRV